MKVEALTGAAKDQLDLVLGFFARVDTRASVVLGIDTAMMGYLAGRIPPLPAIRWYEFIAPLAAFALIGTSLVFLYKGAFPNLSGGSGSLVYFQEIAKKTEAKFIQDFSSQSESDYCGELLGQAWRNSQILSTKFRHLRLGFIFLALAIVPWAVALAQFAMNAKNLAAR